MNAKQLVEFGIKPASNANGEDTGITFKIMASLSLALPEDAEAVKSAFLEHGYDISVVPGEFFKIFTLKGKELVELIGVLDEIDKLGLQEIFQANLRLACFKKAFLERVRFCINNQIPFVNEDGTFTEELFRADTFGEYTARKPVDMLKTAQELSPEIQEGADIMGTLDEEDQSVYRRIVTDLNTLVLRNPKDDILPVVVRNVLVNVIGSIAAKDYYNGIYQMISKVMFNGLDDISEFDRMRIEQLISSAYPEELEQTVTNGRGL